MKPKFSRISVLALVLGLVWGTVWFSTTAAQSNDDAVLLLEHHDNADAIYQVTLDKNQTTLISADAQHTFERFAVPWLVLDGGSLALDLSQANPRVEHYAVADVAEVPPPPFQPLFGPQALSIQLPSPYENWLLVKMSGEAATAVNLYGVIDGAYKPLTDVISLFPAATEPFLSASADILGVRPVHTGLLYRARVRDSAGQDHNALFVYDLETDTTRAIPYFGKDPVWSPDGDWLAGSRIGNENPPLYHLWVVNMETGEEREITTACNPQWSPDGAWLAYDLHNNSQWQGYTDCYANGQVEAINLETGEFVRFTQPDDFKLLIGWREIP